MNDRSESPPAAYSDVLVERLRALTQAYPLEAFWPVLPEEVTAHPGLITRNSAAMGRHFEPIFREAADMIEALVAATSNTTYGESAWKERYEAEREIVDRIWKQLGMPTFEQLAGRSIYDLIDELKRDSARAVEMRNALLELRIRLHATGRRPEECYEMSIIDDALARDENGKFHFHRTEEK